jgi:hypothetical protein
MIWYTYLTAIGLTLVGSSKSHIYTQTNQRVALFIQFIRNENQGPLHDSSITCSSPGGSIQTALDILRGYVSWLCHYCSWFHYTEYTANLLPLERVQVTLCTTRFNILKLFSLPTQCVYVICMDHTTNSDFIHLLLNSLAFITHTECVYCAVRP